MGSEFSIIQMLDGVLGVLISDKLDNASAILEDVRIADISSDSHMILQVLPAAARRQSRDDDAVLGSTWWSIITASSSTTRWRRRVSAATSSTSCALLELDSESVALELVVVATFNSVLRVQNVLEFDEREWWPFSVLEVDVADLAVLVEEVFDVLCANIRWQVADVDSALRFVAHSSAIYFYNLGVFKRSRDLVYFLYL